MGTDVKKQKQKKAVLLNTALHLFNVLICQKRH